MKCKKHETHTVIAGTSRCKRNIQNYLLKYTLMLWIDFNRLTQRIVMGCFEHYRVHFRCNTRELGTCWK